MTEESHREAMNDAIRAQRERAKVPRTMIPADDEPAPVVAAAPEPMTPAPEPEPAPVAKKSFLSRLLGRHS